LLNRIDRKGEEVSKLAFEKGCDRQIEAKILEEASQMKQENWQLKSKVSLGVCRWNASSLICTA
jgi:hypothetical protein